MAMCSISKAMVCDLKLQLQRVSKPCNDFPAHMQYIQFLDSDHWLQNLDKVGCCHAGPTGCIDVICLLHVQYN